jgi:hypothetical protein
MTIRQTLVTYKLLESISPGLQNPNKNPGFLLPLFAARKSAQICSNLLNTCSGSISILPFSLPK